MIETILVDGGLALAAELEPGWVAYVDRDWVPPDPGLPVRALAIEPESGKARFGDGEPRTLAPGDSDDLAARALVDVAHEAAAAVGRLRPVEVRGSGITAAFIAAILGISPGRREGSEQPRAIVETTGDPEAIADATRRLADLGTLVLAGDAFGDRVKLNLYPDVHSRGLVISGVRRPLESENGDGRTAPEAAAPVPVRSGQALDLGAPWYRLA